MILFFDNHCIEEMIHGKLHWIQLERSIGPVWLVSLAGSCFIFGSFLMVWFVNHA